MQLVSVQSLLVLGVLTLPALSASLPGSAVSTGHLLHRRADDSSKGGGAMASSSTSWQRANQAALQAKEFDAGSSSTSLPPPMRTTQIDVTNTRVTGKEYDAWAKEGDTPKAIKGLVSSSDLRLVPERTKSRWFMKAYELHESNDAQYTWADEFSYDSLDSTSNDGRLVTFPTTLDPSASTEYRFEANIEKQLLAGALRRPEAEKQFYERFKHTISKADDPWLSPERKANLEAICDAALVENQQSTDPMQYDVLYAGALSATVITHVTDENLKSQLFEIADETLDFDEGSILPQGLAAAIIKKVRDDHPDDVEAQKTAIYDILRQRVFKYDIQPSDRSDKTIEDLLDSNLDENKVFGDLVVSLGFAYYSGRIWTTIEKTPHYQINNQIQGDAETSSSQLLVSHNDNSITSSPMIYHSELDKYGFDPNIKNQLQAGVFRFPQEKQFYSKYVRAIAGSKDPWLSRNRKRLLITLCENAWRATNTPFSRPMKYDMYFVGALRSAVYFNVDPAVGQRLEAVAADVELDIPTFLLPGDVAKAIAQTFPFNQSDIFENEKAALYAFLRQHVFGYDILPTKRSEEIIQEMVSCELLDRTSLIIDLVDKLGLDYHSARINAALRLHKKETPIRSKL